MAQIVQESVSYLFIYAYEKTVYFTLLPHFSFQEHLQSTVHQ